MIIIYYLLKSGQSLELCEKLEIVLGEQFFQSKELVFKHFDFIDYNK